MIIEDEKSIKLEQGGSFLKLQVGNNKVKFLSNVAVLITHFLPTEKQSYNHIAENCPFCKNGVKKRQEFSYWVELDGEEGVLTIGVGLFAAIQTIEDATGKSKRDVSWIIVKKGSGLETEYTPILGGDIEVTQEQLEENNKKLEKIIGAKEKALVEKTNEYIFKN